MKSQRFRDSRTGEIVTTILLTEIQHFVEYDGPVAPGEFDLTETQRQLIRLRAKYNGEPAPPFDNPPNLSKCPEGHSACVQSFIETGEPDCLFPESGKALDWFDSHVEVVGVGVSAETADQLKDTIRDIFSESSRLGVRFTEENK